MPLDPLTALSVATSVIQVVDFSLKIVSKSRDLYRSNGGVLEENGETETVTIRPEDLTSRLQYPEDIQDRTGQHGTDERTQHNRLRDICQECSEASDELIAFLGKLKVPKWSENRKWKSFRQALKSVWSKKAIDQMASRLEVLRAELDSHILEILRSLNGEKVNGLSIQHDTRFANFDHNAQNIVESIARADTTTKEYMRKGFESLRESDKTEHVKTRAAFIAIDGEKRRNQVDLAFLESLRFPEMNHRYERFAKAHEQTFLWAFRNGIYWIQGKAASGKSTLMLFIQQNDLTQRNLELWSGHLELVVAAFFFWNSGVPEESSQRGLLRSLLFNLLQKRRNFISQVFPEEWDNKSELAAHDLAISTISWSLAQLQRAFARLIAHASQKLRMSFFVDGLDEYDGDPGEIA
ncbi:hypothetical protein BDZ45DRAFT_746174 [Acephala macrosclerotiorum]|nr:hypothetical protein BDZ45DRAFT_746174 [Acephala macrosclerotiorum]